MPSEAMMLSSPPQAAPRTRGVSQKVRHLSPQLIEEVHLTHAAVAELSGDAIARDGLRTHGALDMVSLQGGEFAIPVDFIGQ